MGQRGGIKVDDHMRTSDPSIYAVGEWPPPSLFLVTDGLRVYVDWLW